MKKLITILILICTLTYGQSPAGLWASGYFGSVIADYYVSPDGLNTTGTSPLTAFTSLSSLQAKIDDATISGGDVVAIEKGHVYDGTINDDKGISFVSYGGGSNPVINNYDTILGFSTHPDYSNISYKVLTKEPYWLSYDGRLQAKITNPAYNLTFNSMVNNGDYSVTELTDNELSISTDLSGAEVVIETGSWSYSPLIINSTSGGNTLIVDASDLTYKPASSDDYFLQNHPDYMTSNGNWAWKNDTLFVYSSSAISGHEIIVSSVDTVVYAHGTSETSFDGIDFKGANTYLFIANGTGNFTLKNSNTEKTLQIIEGDMTADKATFENNIFTDNIGQGLRPTRTGNLDSLIVNNNTWVRNGILHGLDRINVKGYNHTAAYLYPKYYLEFTYNTMDSVGGNGFHGGATAVASKYDNETGYNSITTSNLFWIDGAAYYYTSDSAYVHHNYAKDGERGFYFDFGMDGMLVEYNLAEENPYSAIYGNDVKNAIWRYNTGFNNNTNQTFRPQQFGDSATHGYLDNLKIYENYAYATGGYEFQYGLGTVTVPTINWSDVSFGELRDNTYILQSDEARFRTVQGTVGGVANPNTSYTLSGYQALGYEVNSELITSTNPELKKNWSTDSLSLSFSGYRKQDADGNWHIFGDTLPPYTSVIYVDSTIYGFELITNGDFANSSWWNDPLTAWSIGSGVAAFNSTSYLPLVTGSTIMESGKTYLIEFDINVTSGTLEVCSSNSDGSTHSSLNSYSSTQSVSFEYTQVTSPLDYICFLSQTSFNGYIDNVSVREKY